MKKIIICLAFSAAMAAMTSCGKIEKEPTPDRTVHKLTTTSSSTTTTVTVSTDHALTTTIKTDSIKVKKMSYSVKDETTAEDVKKAESAVSKPVETNTVNGNTETNSVNTVSAGYSTTAAASGGNSDNITSTEAETEDIYTEFSEIAGEWIYQKLVSEQQYISDGYINITDDGSFEFYISESGKKKTGTIKKISEYYSSETKIYYSFYENGTEFLTNSFCIPDEPDIRFLGYQETARMVRKEHISEIIDFNMIVGEWEYQERERSSGEYKTVGSITIDEEGNYSYFSNSDSDEKSGNIAVKSEMYANGTEKYYYAFCEDGDTANIWKSCFCEQTDQNIYYAGNGGESRFVRADGVLFDNDFDKLAFKWDYQEYRKSGKNDMDYVTVGCLTIDGNGHYTYTSLDGKEERYGVIRNDTDEAGNEIIAFYDYGQYLWNYFQFIHLRCIEFYFEDSDTEARIVYHENDNNPGGDDFVGIWGDYNTYVCCERFLDGYNVIISRDFEYGNNTYEHSGGEFYCLYDEENDILVCECAEEYVYEKYRIDDIEGYVVLDKSLDKNASAIFRLDNGKLIWKNTVTGEETAFILYEEEYD